MFPLSFLPAVAMAGELTCVRIERGPKTSLDCTLGNFASLSCTGIPRGLGTQYTCDYIASGEKSKLNCYTEDRNLKTYFDCTEISGEDTPWVVGDLMKRNRTYSATVTKQTVPAKDTPAVTPSTAAPVAPEVTDKKTEGVPINPQTITLPAEDIINSEYFVYASTNARNGMIESYFETICTQKHIADKLGGKVCGSTKSYYHLFEGNLNRLETVIADYLPPKDFPLTMTYKQFTPFLQVARKDSGIYWISIASQTGAELGLTFSDEKLSAIGIFIKPMIDASIEQRQLQLLINRRLGWPNTCIDQDAILTCKWERTDEITTLTRIQLNNTQMLLISLTPTAGTREN